MSGKRIIDGLREAVEYMDGTADKSAYKVHEVTPVRLPDNVDVKTIRTVMGLTQAMSAAQFGFSVNTLRNWEQGKRRPDPAVRTYLRVIEKAPDTVRAALAG